MRFRFLVTGALALTLLLPGCDKLGAVIPGQGKADSEAEGKAIGSACRHAGRAIEDCFTLNAKANKAAVFEGWRDMNDYMTKNKIEVVAPVVPREAPKPATPPPAPVVAEPHDEAPAEEPRKPGRGNKSRTGNTADNAHEASAIPVTTRAFDAERRPPEPSAARDTFQHAQSDVIRHAPPASTQHAQPARHDAERAAPTALASRAPQERRSADGPTGDSRDPELLAPDRRGTEAPSVTAFAERQPVRIPAVGAGEISRAKAYANTP